MNSLVPWRGACEKHPIFIQMFVEVLYKLGIVVVDYMIEFEIIGAHCRYLCDND
jgi:hypothetical protein